jgi:hypothetical protein
MGRIGDSLWSALDARILTHFDRTLRGYPIKQLLRNSSDLVAPGRDTLPICFRRSLFAILAGHRAAVSGHLDGEA